jgi:hypothetical protein
MEQIVKDKAKQFSSAMWQLPHPVIASITMKITLLWCQTLLPQAFMADTTTQSHCYSNLKMLQLQVAMSTSATCKPHFLNPSSLLWQAAVTADASKTFLQPITSYPYASTHRHLFCPPRLL